MNWNLYIDSKNNIPEHYNEQKWYQVTDYFEIAHILATFNSMPQVISVNTDFTEDYSGYKIIKWLLDIDKEDEILKLPEDFEIFVHAGNEKDKILIDNLIEDYKNTKTNTFIKTL
jgi:hypothetical protein